VLVEKAGSAIGLALETLAIAVVVTEPVRETLQRDDAAVPGIVSEVHLAHPASPQFAVDPESTNASVREVGRQDAVSCAQRSGLRHPGAFAPILHRAEASGSGAIHVPSGPSRLGYLGRLRDR
jgi:hypothetical protein